MPVYLTPGVYRRPKRTDADDVRLVRTDVAAFVGCTERGPLPFPERKSEGIDLPESRMRDEDLAVRLTSWDEYRATFGGFIADAFLPYAVRGFFENGGRTCYVVRVASVRADDPKRAAYARWGFPSELVGSGDLISQAVSGARAVDVDNAAAIAGCDLVEIVDAAGSPSERHVPVRADGTRLALGGPLRGSYAVGSTVRGYRSALVLEATSAGAWGNRIRATITPLADETTEFGLLLDVASGLERPIRRETELYRRLSLEPNDPAYAPLVVNPRSKLIRFRAPLERPQPGTRVVRIDPTLIGDRQVALEGGADGLSTLIADDFTGESGKLCGLRIIELVDEVSVLCAPDAVFERPVRVLAPVVPNPPCAPPVTTSAVPVTSPPGDERRQTTPPDMVSAALIAQCERLRDRVAIIDLPAAVRGIRSLQSWRGSVASRFAATYYPWLAVSDPLQPDGRAVTIPPSGHVAGIYAQLDNAYGVHWPPANAALNGVIDLADTVVTAQQDQLNPIGINVLRSFPGRGIRVWGARSLAALDDSDWRFIHVRRLMSMIEESVETSMQWTVFEPHDDALRLTLVHALSVFLTQIWHKGGLQGSTPQEAYFVRCDDTNNPQAAVDTGQLVCQVGVAVAAPMEFLVFEIRQKPEGAEVIES